MLNLASKFPILSRQIDNHRLVYLDNAASSQKPQVVIDALSNYYEQHNANVHRGVHTLAEESTQLYFDSREVVAQFINAMSKEIVFVRNTTEGINLLAYAWGLANLKSGDEIIVSQMEHHSNIVPWQLICEKTGAVLKFIALDDDGKLALKGSFASKDTPVGSLEELLSNKTKVVSLVHVSNALSTVNPIREIFHKVKKYNPQIKCFVDGAQSVPHMPIDVKTLGADGLVFSAHKMCGPMGIGVLWAKAELLEQMPPFLGGGDMISDVYYDYSTYNKIPAKFEAGTPNVSGAVGLAAACRFLTEVGMENIATHTHELGKYCIEQLSQFEGISILGPKDLESRSSLVAFSWQGKNAHDIAQVLNSVGVAVRSGHHCTQILHRNLGINGSVRISPYLYNSKEDIDQAIFGMEKVATLLK